MVMFGPSVTSEPLRVAPDVRVLDWIDAQPIEE